MNVRTVTSYSIGKHLLVPELEQDGMVLTVTIQGEVRSHGKSYPTPGSFDFRATSHATEEIGVCGYLVLDSEEQLDLLIDQVGGDFPSERYEFEPDGPYTRVALLFSFRVPPGLTKLDEVEVVLYRTLAREKRESSKPRLHQMGEARKAGADLDPEGE